MSFNRRQFIGLMGATGAVAALGSWPLRGMADTSALGDITLNVATYKINYTQFMDLAGEADTPYKVHNVFVPFDVALRSIAAGDIDVGMSFTDIPLTIWGQSLDGIRLVGVANNVIVNKLLAVVVPPGSKIENVAQLKGKRVGYLKASNQHYFLLKLLEQNGLTFDDIVPAALTLDMGRPAFLSGQLDAWITQGSDTLIAQRTNGGRELASAAEGYVGNSLICANQKALDDPRRLAAITDYLQRADRTLRWLDANPEAWAQRSHELTGISLDIYREQAGLEGGRGRRLYAASPRFIRQQQQAADFLHAKGVARQALDVSSLWDNRLAGALGVLEGN
ncbi:hypothetical protein PS3A_00560 [Pseudomonas sp. 3A(2025)]